MGAILLEWVDFAVRWLHVIAGIAWIGSSFYFVHLDLSLKKREGLPEGAGGETWQVHGGGFYNMVKYLVAPARLPDQLTWFKWEAYTTWISGMALLVLIYYLSAGLYLIDISVLDISPIVAVLISLVGLGLGWGVYHLLCKSPLGRNEVALAAVGFAFLVVLSFVFTLIFSGRGAYMQMGALIGSMMVGNVFFVIIPNQRKVVAALRAGEEPDPELGREAKQRSVHNNYLTLPVIFVMIGNHYPQAFGSKWNWLILSIVLVVGALIRHFFNERHKGAASPWWTWAAAVAGMILVVLLSLPPSNIVDAKATPETDMADVELVILSRCSMCHAKEPLWEGIATPPKGVVLETQAEIRRQATPIALQSVYSTAMPPGNITEMEEAERELLAAWINAGAPGWEQ